jgi:CRISPR-associated protein Csd2
MSPDTHLPRMDDDTGHLLTSDVWLKRLVRDQIRRLHPGEPGFGIFITTTDDEDNDRILNLKMRDAYDKLGLKPSDPGAEKMARQYMCENKYDVRTFGAVMNTGKGGRGEEEDAENGGSRYSAGQVTGPIQVTFGRSIDPVSVMDHSITRKCVTSEAIAKKQIEKNHQISGTMGRKATVPYALCRSKCWYLPMLAESSGFSAKDLEAFFKALATCFNNSRTASRGHMSFRGAYVFVHSSELGDCSDHELFDLLTVSKKVEFPRSYKDYDVKADAPSGPVKLFVIKNGADVDAMMASLR